MKNLPKKFYQRLENIYSKNEIETILNWLNTQKRKVSFRVNHLKSNSREIEEVLKQNNINFTKKEFLNDSYILNSWREKDLWDLEIFKDWKIYMQSISSQIPVLFLDLKTWNRVLDVTSAPWSKTSQIADILNNSWEVIANDNNAIRIDKLKFNDFLAKTFFNRKIKYAIITVSDFHKRLEYSDKLIFNIIKQPWNLFLIDNLWVQEMIK